MTPNPDLKGTPLFDVEYLRNTARYSYNSYKPLKRTKRHHFMIKNRKKNYAEGAEPSPGPSLSRKEISQKNPPFSAPLN